jgi:hypothetical protein
MKNHSRELSGASSNGSPSRGDRHRPIMLFADIPRAFSIRPARWRSRNSHPAQPRERGITIAMVTHEPTWRLLLSASSISRMAGVPVMLNGRKNCCFGKLICWRFRDPAQHHALFFTILGIVNGVAAVINILTIARPPPPRQAVDCEHGSNILMIVPASGWVLGSHVDRALQGGRCEAITIPVGAFTAEAPVSSQNAQAEFGNENWSTQVTGA